MKKVIMIVLILLTIINPAFNIPAYGALVEEKPTDKNSLLQNTDAAGPLVKTHLQNQNNNAISIESNTSPLQTFWVSNDCFLRKVEVEIYWKLEAKSASTGDLILDIAEVGSSKFKVISSKVKSKNEIPKNRSMDGKYQITSFQFDPGVPLKADTTYGIRFRSPDCEPINPMETGYEWSFFGYSSPLGDKYENGELLSNFDGENYEEVHGDGVFSIYVSKGIIILNTGKPYMTVNGVKKDIENGKQVSPVIKDGRTLIPIKALIEQLGGSVTWSGSEKKISINLNSKLIELWINSNTVSINGVKKNIDSSPSIINSRTFVPLRLITESLGCKVNWNPKEKSITLEYGNLDDITINPVPAPTPTINSKKINVNFNDLYNTNDLRLNWYDEDGPVPAEVGYNLGWLKSRGLRLTCYPNVSIRMTYFSSTYGMTGNIVGFGDSGISGEKVMSFNFIESLVKSAEIDFAVVPTENNLNVLSKVKINAYDKDDKLIKSDLFEFTAIKNGVYSTKKYKFESDISISKLSISSVSWTNGGIYISSINYEKI